MVEAIFLVVGFASYSITLIGLMVLFYFEKTRSERAYILVAFMAFMTITLKLTDMSNQLAQ